MAELREAILKLADELGEHGRGVWVHGRHGGVVFVEDGQLRFEIFLLGLPSHHPVQHRAAGAALLDGINDALDGALAFATPPWKPSAFQAGATVC